MLNQGFSYELKVISYLALKYSDPTNGIKDFKILENSDDCGNFDDVVVAIEKESGEKLKLFLQLKHSTIDGLERRKKLTSKTFTAKKGNQFSFNLQKSWETLRHVEVNTDNAVKYVLYTNKDANEDDPNFVPYDKEDVGLVQIGGAAFQINNYQFQTNNEEEEERATKFRQNFVILSTQPHEEDMENVIIGLISRMFDSDLEHGIARKIAVNFIKFLDSWQKGHCGEYTSLSKEKIQFKIIELVTKYNFPQFDLLSMPTITEEQMKAANTSTYNVVFVENIGADAHFKEVLPFVYGFMKTTLAQYITISNWNSAISEEDFRLLCKKISNARKETIELWGNKFVNKLTVQQMYLYLWWKNILPLVLCTNNVVNLKKIMAKLHLNNKRFVIVDDYCDSNEIIATLKSGKI